MNVTKCSLRGSEPAAKQRVENCPIVVSDHNCHENEKNIDENENLSIVVASTAEGEIAKAAHCFSISGVIVVVLKHF